ncbi:MAG: hypothetical protein J6K73_05025 [Clostridia bacterium]|nr:hypothetical protein [Clostridia bacterium]
MYQLSDGKNRSGTDRLNDALQRHSPEKNCKGIDLIRKAKAQRWTESLGKSMERQDPHWHGAEMTVIAKEKK